MNRILLIQIRVNELIQVHLFYNMYIHDIVDHIVNNNGLLHDICDGCNMSVTEIMIGYNLNYILDNIYESFLDSLIF